MPPRPHRPLKEELAGGLSYVRSQRAVLTLTVLVFFSTFLAMPIHGGKAYDDNGYLPFAVDVFGKKLKLDVNATAFSVFFVILIAGALAISRGVS